MSPDYRLEALSFSQRRESVQLLVTLADVVMNMHKYLGADFWQLHESSKVHGDSVPEPADLDYDFSFWVFIYKRTTKRADHQTLKTFSSRRVDA
jgi:hypothetical protein